ncbi:MAG: hypothetical protein M3P42_07220 [Actinomycetota bacterium]|nr:hypothetical protein [Actinomycetota bacterium]
MTKAIALLGASTFALLASSWSHGSFERQSRERSPVRELRRLSLEFIGQFQNSAPGVTPPTHIHYGYLSYIRGLSVFRAAAQDEKSALFTFYSEAATPRVIANGPLRIVTRVGRLTIYRDPSTNGDFARPGSFRDGTPVLVARLRQQVVTNTVTGSFTTFHQNTIVSTRPFPVGRRSVRLGRVGATFRTVFSGHVTMPGPPSGYFGGYAVSG